MIETQEFRGTRGWHAVAREEAVAALNAQLDQMQNAPRTRDVPMLVDVAIGAALPYLEAGWRDAVLRFIDLDNDLGGVIAMDGRKGCAPAYTELDRVIAFLWRQIPPSEVERLEAAHGQV